MNHGHPINTPNTLDRQRLLVKLTELSTQGSLTTKTATTDAGRVGESVFGYASAE